MNVRLRLSVLLSQAPSHQPGVESQPLEETFGGGWGWGDGGGGDILQSDSTSSWRAPLIKYIFIFTVIF